MRVIVLRKQEIGLTGEMEGAIPEDVQQQLEERQELLERIGSAVGRINEAIEDLSATVAEVSQALQDEGQQLTNDDLRQMAENLERVSEEAQQAAQGAGVAAKKLLKGMARTTRAIALRKQQVEGEDPQIKELFEFLERYERTLEEIKRNLAESEELSRKIRESLERIGPLPVSPEEFVEEFKRVGREAEEWLRRLKEEGLLSDEEIEGIRKADGTISIITDDDLDLQKKFKLVADTVYSLFPPKDEIEESNLKQAIEDLKQVLQDIEESVTVIKVEGD
jgi:prefoldin subunit 5